MTTASPTTLEPDDQDRPYQEYALYLLSTAEKWGKDTQNSVWWAKFVAGSISFASISLPARCAALGTDDAVPKKSEKELRRWRNIVEFTNMLIKDLFHDWKEAAFLVPHTLAGE